MAEETQEQTAAQAAPAAEEKPFPLKTILGQKVGMSMIFSETGERIPVSVILASDCVATVVKSVATDGYNSVQLGVGECNEKNLAKPYLAQFKKNNLTPTRWLKEFKVKNPENFSVGQKVNVDVFTPGDFVDVSGTTKGKGFAGVIKRHGFSGLPTSHGASDKVRSRGSSGGGSGQPQRVFKGTGMAGHMGNEWVTIQNLEVVKVDKERHLLLVKGAIPGVSQGLVVVRETTKPLKHKRPVQVKATKKSAVPKKAPAKPAPAAKK